MELTTKTKITWCPGCPNFGILASFKQAMEKMIDSGEIRKENIVVGSGIGCHGKITEYLNLNSFTALHGRAVATLTGIKIANPALKVIAFCGDGDAYAEGMEHLIHAAKRNTDITVIIHNNQTFALTTGQFTPTSPKGFKGKTTPYGSLEEPINSLALMLTAGASFVARSYALDIGKTADLITAAVRHKGFSILEIIQPCIAFNDTRAYFSQKNYWLPANKGEDNMSGAMALASETERMPLGIFYRAEKPVFEDLL